MSYMPRGKRFEVDQVFSNTRYSTKSVTKINEDLDRYGRFQIVTKSGSVKTITGKLSVILLNNAVSSYREIR